MLVGEGPQLGEARRVARERDVSDRVRFLGLRSDLADLLAPADLFCLASTEESFGLSALEAMSAGTAVLGTRVGGVAEVVTDGTTGVLVDPEDRAAYASEMARLLGDRGGGLGPGWRLATAPWRASTAARWSRSTSPSTAGWSATRGPAPEQPGGPQPRRDSRAIQPRVDPWPSISITTRRRRRGRRRASSCSTSSIRGSATPRASTGPAAAAARSSTRRGSVSRGPRGARGRGRLHQRRHGVQQPRALRGPRGALGGRERVRQGGLEPDRARRRPRARAATGRRGRDDALVVNDDEGRIDPAEVAAAAGAGRAGIVTLMAANNEIGSVVDLPAVRTRWAAGPGSSCTPTRCSCSANAPRAASSSVDLASLSAHKVGGPVGGRGFSFARRDSPRPAGLRWLRRKRS